MTAIGWRQDGGALKTSAIALTVPANNTTVTLVYGDDEDGDGKEDIAYTVRYLDALTGAPASG